MTNKRASFMAIGGACAALLLGGTITASATTPPTTPAGGSAAGGAAGSGWAVTTDDCVDPAAATEKITGDVMVGSIMPLSGGGPAILFAPVKDGFAAAIEYADETKVLGDQKIGLQIQDDQYKAELTPGALTKLLDAKVHVISGVIGTPNNEAIRQTLNDNCIPQLNNLTGSPQWGESKDFPWTTGALVPYDIETKAYVADLVKQFPNGAKVALYYVDTDFGKVYADTLKAIAADNKIEIVDEQTVGPEDNTPPTSQATSIASKKPDAIIAAPLGLGCGTFLKEIAAKTAADTSWKPRTYVTATCASPLLMAAAGAAADGMITSTNLLNVADPANASNPAVKTYLDYMKKINFQGDVTVASTGWTVGEVTVAILAQAAKSPDGLTRASILNAARNLHYHASLARPGIDYVTNGDADPYPAQSLVLQQFSSASGTFTDLGPVVTQFETK